jgi:hypothetical protein
MFKKPKPKPLQQNPIPGSVLTLKQQQQQQQQQEKKNRDEAELVRDVNILRNLLTDNFAEIPNQGIQVELTALLGIYRNDLKFLIISIIDIIHDAHHTRDPGVNCYRLPLFKLVVCNIFGISYALYEYILKSVIPVSQSVLIRLIETTPGMSGTTAQSYFTTQAAQQQRQQQPNAAPQQLLNVNIVRDNVGLNQLLTQEILNLGFQIVYAKTPCIVLDSVSVPMSPADYDVLDRCITVHQGPKQVTNQLFPGTVTITVSGSHAVNDNYKARFEYNAPNAHLFTAAAATIAAAPPPATAPAAYAAAAAAAAVGINSFDLNFPWNPTSNPLVGYKPLECSNIPPTINQNPNPITSGPPNHTKNCAFIIAIAQGAAGGVGRAVAADPNSPQAAQEIIDANARLYIELARVTVIAGNPAGFQNLTLQQYILFKLAGDFSYCLYVLAIYLTFVSTSDIISGLRLSLLGINVLFSIASGLMVFHQNINMNAPVVARYIPAVLNLISRKCKVETTTVKQKLSIWLSKNKNKNKYIVNLAPTTGTNKSITLPTIRQSPRLLELLNRGIQKQPLVGGQYGGDDNVSSFDIMLLAAVHNPWFSKELSPLIKSVINPTISHENLELLIKVLKNQFKIFKDQLDKFEKGGKFFMFSNSTPVNYRSSCTTIIKYLNAIFDIMSSEEFIAYFTTNCSVESYQECIKIMRQYVIMFPFIFDAETSSWYLNYTYPFSVCLNEYILSLLENKPKDPENLNRIKEIINFVSNLKTISRTELDVTPLEYGKKMPFNVAVTFVIMSECIKTGTQQQFFEQHKLYKQQSNLHLTKFDDNSLREFFLKQLSPLIPKDTNGDTSGVEVTSENTSDDTRGENVTPEDTYDYIEYFKEIDNFFQNFVVDNNILYEDFVNELVSFLIQNNNIIREGVFSVIKFILLFQNFDNIALCSYTVIKTIIEALLSQKYVNESFAFINNDFNILFYYNNLDNFFQDIPEVVTKIKDTRISEGLTSIDQLSILEENISVQIDLYGYCVDYALSKFYDELYDDSIDSGRTFQTTDDYVDFQMEKLQEFIDKEVDKYLSYHEIEEEEEEKQHIDPLSLSVLTQKETQNLQLVDPVYGGKNNHKSKHNAKYRKKYKKFVSKYIIKKKKNKNKSTISTSTKNKTKKNKKIAKNKSKYAKKTLKNKKRKSKSKSSNNKSKHNKKAKTNYYNLYRHNKTLKH